MSKMSKMSENNQQSSEKSKVEKTTTKAEDATTQKRRPSLFLSLFPIILVTSMSFIKIAVCKFFVFIIGSTIGITEEGKELVYFDYSAGVIPSLLIYFTLPRIIDLISKNKFIKSPATTSKWITRGIVAGILFFIFASTISAAYNIDEMSALKFSHAITATGSLIWVGLVNVFSSLFNKKIREEIRL